MKYFFNLPLFAYHNEFEEPRQYLRLEKEIVEEKPEEGKKEEKRVIIIEI